MPADAFTIVRIGAADQLRFAAIAPDVFDEAIDTGRLKAYLAAPGHIMVLAFEGDLVVGQCAGVIHHHPDKPTELYIDEVGVTPALRRRGIARRMLDEAFAWGRSQGCEEAWVGTEPDNEAAIGLYRGFGEEPVPIVMFEYEL